MTTIDALNTPNLVLNPSGPRNDDPFEASTPKLEDRKAPHRFSAFDTQLFTSYQPAASPATAKRALEAHLSETDRRLEEASKLGTALVQQRQDITEKLKEVEVHISGQELGPELRQKLAEVEKEYNELGRETARAFLAHKSRAMNGDGETPARSASPTKFSSQATDSPSKMSVPSRKQRNQPTNSVGDIELATEISTSLLSQVRQLQAILAERDESLKTVTLDRSKLKMDNEGLLTRLKALDENEQKYKDENWSLETQTHELMAAARESTAREQKMQQSLALVTSQKSAAQRELDDVKQAHGKISDDLAASKKIHDAETSGLRKNALAFETERTTLQRKIDELTMQNQELAQGMTGRFRQNEDAAIPHLQPEPEEFFLDATDTDHSPPPSPTKGAARNSLLESETLKSSLHHAHRMIQTLKSNIHREKTEKLELKRMLQDTRDELEQRRNDVNASSKRSKSKALQDTSKKNIRIGQLGAGRHSQNSVEMLDPEWSDHAEDSPRPGLARAFTGDTTTDTYQTATETEDNFETADEQPIESEAFQTGNEDVDSGADLTETETNRRHTIIRRGKEAFAVPYPQHKRDSFVSTASTSDEEGSLQTPILGSVKYRGKPGNRRSRFTSEDLGSSPVGIRDSPASFVGTGNGQSLFAELEDLHDGSDGDAASTPDRFRGTPVRGPGSTFVGSPSKLSNQSTTASPPKAAMVDSSMMTEAWQNETQPGHAPSGIFATNTTADSPTILPKVLSPNTPVKTARDTATQFSPFNTPFAKDKTSQPLTPTVGIQDTAAQSSMNSTPIPQSRTVAVGTPRGAPVTHKPLRFSSITSADIRPKMPPTDATTASSQDVSGVAKDTFVGSSLAGLFGKRQATPEGRTATGQSSTYVVSTPQRKTSFKDLSPNIGLRTLPSPAPKIPLPVPMTDSGVQTTLLSTQIDNLLLTRTNKTSSTTPLSIATAGLPRSEALASAKLDSTTPTRPGSQQSHTYSFTPRDVPYLPSKSPRRPGSSQSSRSATFDAPPLPADIRAAMTAANLTTPLPVKERIDPRNDISMGPPTMTAAAYRAAQKKAQKDAEPQTPASIGSATPKPRYSTVRSMRSRKSSMSSFESELDARFNIRTANLPMGGWDGGTDPRMIQAITQTMIGEYLWKYTRKAGRGEMSAKRHRRYFWVHPYTRTLYWSEQDPSTAGRAQLKAKSVAIEAVRVVADDNPMPPGLHRKSLVVITPGRDIKFTATTGQRHETWFNALSYLLLRSAEGQTPDSQALTAEDVAEFNPGLGHGRTSRVSLSSYNSRTNTTTRSLASLRGGSLDHNPAVQAPSTLRATNSTRSNHGNNHLSVGSRISSLLRPSRSSATSFQGRPGSSQQQGSIYNASVVNDSAEDVRKVLERQDQEADTLENVRACCDGMS